jgi:hypothetical protein
MQQHNPQHLASAFTDDEVRTASPERRAWLFRVLALAHTTGAPVELAKRAVEEADKAERLRQQAQALEGGA